MKLGTPTICPVCKHVHPFGARLGTPYDRLRYCSDKCEAASVSDEVKPLQSTELLDFTKPRLELTVWCNCCVSRFNWTPSVDGGDCPRCGYRLSLYAPFEPKPSFAAPIAPPPAMPLTITRY